MASARGQTSGAGLTKHMPELCSLSVVKHTSERQNKGGRGHTVRCSPSSFSNVAKPKFFRVPLLQAHQDSGSHKLIPSMYGNAFLRFP
jgi:hypothetical protein